MGYRLTLQLTRQCNLQCDYCYEKNRDAGVMSLATAEQAVELALTKISGPGALDLHFFGGEPLLTFDRLGEIQNLARQKCDQAGVSLRSFVVTNGTLLNKERWEYLRRQRFGIGISLDGLAEAHGQHRKFPDGQNSFFPVWTFLMSLPMEERGNLNLNLVLTPRNVRYLPETLPALVAAGFRHFSFSPDYSADWNQETKADLDRIFHLVQESYINFLHQNIPVFFSFVEEKIRRILDPKSFPKVTCRFGRGEMAVDPAGNIYPCDRMINTGTTGGFCLGRVQAGDNVSPEAPLPRKRPKSCAVCEVKSLCTHFCGCVNFARTGDINRPDDLICFFERLFIRAAQHVAEEFLGHPVVNPAPCPARQFPAVHPQGQQERKPCL